MRRRRRRAVRRRRRNAVRHRSGESTAQWYKRFTSSYPKKWIGGGRVPARRIGKYRDEKGRVWNVYKSVINRLSAHLRLERPGHKAKSVYDAGGGFVRAYVRGR